MKLLYYVLGLICLLNYLASFAAIDCLSNKNEDINQWYDSKNYRLVKHVYDGKTYPCTCPCEKYGLLDDRGKCTRCGHYHEARPLVVVKTPIIKRRGTPTKVRRVAIKEKPEINWLVSEELPIFQ